jgi:hypothetical protein
MPRTTSSLPWFVDQEGRVVSDRARSVLKWMAELERRPDLDEYFDDVIADHRLAPGSILFISPQPLLSLDLEVSGDA